MTKKEKDDIFSQTQMHMNNKFNRELKLISQYQRQMDDRLSHPKKAQRMPGGKITRNTVFAERGEEAIMGRSDSLNRSGSPQNYRKYK